MGTRHVWSTDSCKTGRVGGSFDGWIKEDHIHLCEDVLSCVRADMQNSNSYMNIEGR